MQYMGMSVGVTAGYKQRDVNLIKLAAKSNEKVSKTLVNTPEMPGRGVTSVKTTREKFNATAYVLDRYASILESSVKSSFGRTFGNARRNTPTNNNKAINKRRDEIRDQLTECISAMRSLAQIFRNDRTSSARNRGLDLVVKLKQLSESKSNTAAFLQQHTKYSHKYFNPTSNNGYKFEEVTNSKLVSLIKYLDIFDKALKDHIIPTVTENLGKLMNNNLNRVNGNNRK